MTNTSRAALRMSAVATALAATTFLSTAAYAEYRCATPGLLWLGEKKACELARQPTPDALVRFVHRTQGTYNLYINDYVDDGAGARWHQAKQSAIHHSTKVAEAKVRKASKVN
jgi:hypothetical protein